MRMIDHLVCAVRTPRMFATALLALPLLAVVGQSAQTTPKTLKGEVTDTICAKSGSHDEMMAKMQSMGRDGATCTKKCAELGAKYILYDKDNKTVYDVDNQAKVEAFAGQEVRVTGTLDGNKIKVTDVRAVG